MFEVHDRRVSHQVARLVDRGEGVAHLARLPLDVLRQHGHAREVPDPVPEVVDAHGLAAPDVEHLAGDAYGGRGAGGEQIRVNHVRDVHEIARLRAVAVNQGRLPLQRRMEDSTALAT